MSEKTEGGDSKSPSPTDPKVEKTALVSEHSTEMKYSEGALPEKEIVSDKGTEGESNEKPTGGCCGNCCHKHCRMFFNKSFYFSFAGGIGCVLPYVAIYLKQMGLSPQEIGLITGLRPLIGFLSAPVWGIIGDRYSIRRVLLLVSIVAWLAFNVGLLFIKPTEFISSCPAAAAVDPDGAVQVLERGFQAPSDARLRRAVELPAGSPTESSNDSILTSKNYTEKQLEDMSSHLGWLYDPADIQRVLVTALALIMAGELMQSPTTALADTGTLQMLQAQGLDVDSYGRQRAWGAVGHGLSAFLAGSLVSMTRQNATICGVDLYFSNYRLIAYVFICFMVLAFISATQIKFKEEGDAEQTELTDKASSSTADDDKPSADSTLAVFKLFLNVHYGSWLSTAFFIGVCNGVIWGFLYWHLENLGASQLVMGVDSTIQCASEFITFFFVGAIIQKIGHMGILYIGLLCYAVRFIIYAVITNPWWVLPAEVLQGVTFSCTWVSMTSYTTIAVPSFSLATIQGILHGVYFGLGTGTGNLLGGILIGAFGARITFYSFAAACIVVLALFAIAQKCSTKPKSTTAGYKDLDADQ